MSEIKIEIREAETVAELTECVALQKKVFKLPDLEISPVRHLIVTKNAGGFTLAALADGKIVGFVLSVPMFAGEKRAFYSHMMAVDDNFQNHGIGAKLKWAQRARSLAAHVTLVVWTFQPVQARNAFLNLEKLGAEIRHYKPNFYGTDYSTAHLSDGKIGIDSDRLLAEWHLESEKVAALSKGEKFTEKTEPAKTVEVINNWNDLFKTDPRRAALEQEKIKAEFQAAFAENLVCRSFERSATNPKYLLYKG